jgi:hypothetical protein
MPKEKGKTSGDQIGPAAHCGPHECSGARSRPAQQAAHGREPAARSRLCKRGPAFLIN